MSDVVQKENLAFVFPGQGSQSEHMLADCLDHPIVIKTFAEADEALGYSLSDIIKNGTAKKLGQTEITQPALLTVSIALWRIWCAENKVRPSLLAGHSLGEYSALVAAGSLRFSDAVTLVSNRGKYMQEAVPEGVGAMAAIIGLDDAEVIAACAEISTEGDVAAVNFNSPGQVVIAGKKDAVNQACELVKAKGARRALLLPVSVPSHCILMKPASEQLASTLEGLTLSAPEITVIHNADVKSHQDESSIKTALVSQLYQPVRWTETIQAFSAQGITNVIECGAGKVLTGLIRRINKELTSYNIMDKASLDDVSKKIN